MNVLRGVVVANLFFEPSTRTRVSFELAAKYLGAHVINFPVSDSSQAKGETLLDTLHCLEAMGVCCLVVRHSMSGLPYFIARHVKHRTTVINAGDGCHEHPTQALLDMYTLWRVFSDFHQRRIAIVGDIAHSRVARSNIQALMLLGAQQIRLVAPPTLLPKSIEGLGSKVCVYHNLAQGIEGVDAVIALRLQKERMGKGRLTTSEAFQREYRIELSHLASMAPDALILHPGPVNRGVELSHALMHSPRLLVGQQVTYGVAIRMALLMHLVGKPLSERKSNVE